MNPYVELFPPIEDLLSARIEHVALALLTLTARRGRTENGRVVLRSIAYDGDSQLAEYAMGQREEVVMVLAEAAAWLKSQSFVAEDPRVMIGTAHFVTRRGHAWLASADPIAWLAGSLIRDRALDPELEADVSSHFVSGRLDNAVASAFRRVEIRLRTRSGVGATVRDAPGVASKAFATDAPRGSLAINRSIEDQQVTGERWMVAGAMARFRNPTTHGDIGLDDPAEAVELIGFANLLLRLIENAAREAGGTP